MPSTTTLTITADQRAPIHRQAIQHLSGIGDVYGAYARGEYAVAVRFADEYVEDLLLLLLSDLGWAPDDSRESFELTMPADELTLVLRRLQGEAEDGLSEAEEWCAAEETEQVRSAYRRTREVCAELLSVLNRDHHREGGLGDNAVVDKVNELMNEAHRAECAF
jgi:hypothetical protein